jgi:hypothetical protein
MTKRQKPNSCDNNDSKKPHRERNEVECDDPMSFGTDSSYPHKIATIIYKKNTSSDIFRQIQKTCYTAF